MRTTLNIDARVLSAFKRRSAETHQSLSKLIEDALRDSLSRERDSHATAALSFPIVAGDGVFPGVDLTNNAALADYLDLPDGESS